MRPQHQITTKSFYWIYVEILLIILLISIIGVEANDDNQNDNTNFQILQNQATEIDERVVLQTLQPAPLNTDINIASTIADLLTEAQNMATPIPMIFHFVINNENNFNIVNYLSLYSIHQVYTNASIYCHIIDTPSIKNPWWALAAHLCTENIPVRNPEHIFGRQIRTPLTKSMVLRLEALLKYGGIAIDDDVIVLRQLDAPPLITSKDNRDDAQIWMNDFVIISQTERSSPHNSRVSAAFVAGRSRSKFLQEWFSTFRVWGEPTEKVLVMSDHNRLLQQLVTIRPHLFAPVRVGIMDYPILDEKSLRSFYNPTMKVDFDSSNYAKQYLIHFQQSEIQRIPAAETLTSSFDVPSWEEFCTLQNEYGHVLRFALSTINLNEFRIRCPGLSS